MNSQDEDFSGHVNMERILSKSTQTIAACATSLWVYFGVVWGGGRLAAANQSSWTQVVKLLHLVGKWQVKHIKIVSNSHQQSVAGLLISLE